MEKVLHLEDKNMVAEIKEQFTEAKKILEIKDVHKKYEQFEKIVKGCVEILNKVAKEEVIKYEEVMDVLKCLQNTEGTLTTKMSVFDDVKPKCHLLDISEAFAVKIGPFYCNDNPTSAIMSDITTEPQMALVQDLDYNNLFLSEQYITEDNEDLGDRRVDHFLNVTEITLMNLTNKNFMNKLLKNFDKEALLNFIGSNFPSVLFSISKN